MYNYEHGLMFTPDLQNAKRSVSGGAYKLGKQARL